MALITLQRAVELLPNWQETDNQLMEDILVASSDTIERYCSRTFAVTAYDELYNGSGFDSLLLNNYPITSIDRVLLNPSAVVQIRNTDTGVQRASFRLDATSLYLTSVKNAVTTTKTLTRTSYPMLSDLATGINTYSADGWAASALGIYTTWATADLFQPQGGNECRWTGAAYLKLHQSSLASYNIKPEIGEIQTPFGFTRGYQNVRVVYSAGFSPVPTPIQQACAELAYSVFNMRFVNPNLASENASGSWSYSALADKSFNSLSLVAKYGLSLYKNMRVVYFKSY